MGPCEGWGETGPALGSAGAQIRAVQAFSSGLGKVSLFWHETSHSSLSLEMWRRMRFSEDSESKEWLRPVMEQLGFILIAHDLLYFWRWALESTS